MGLDVGMIIVAPASGCDSVGHGLPGLHFGLVGFIVGEATVDGIVGVAVG